MSLNDWWKGGQDDLESYSEYFSEIFNRVDYRHLTDKKISPIIQEVFSRNKVTNLMKEKDFEVHLNYSTLVSGYYAAKKLDTVYDIADDLSAMIKESPQIPSLLRSVGGIFGDIMLKKNISISSKITLTTDNLGKTYSIPENKSEIISNGVDTNLFRNYGQKMKEELGLNGFILGYVGVLREWIDFEPVFSVLNELENEINLVIVGKEGRFKENIELAKRYDLKDRVKFIGMVPYSQVPKYISAMDICLIPFRKSAISESAVPLKLFEYMACEKPIISTRLSSIEKVARDKILYASNKEEYKDKITMLFEDDKLRRKMGLEGRSFVEENYDWERIAGRMEMLLLQI
ncbi:MAG: glycosyltransferase [Candidatus Methanoperedens sp.]|nr:glycosyltransferase [Candidatus Methanoperedens sp.]